MSVLVRGSRLRRRAARPSVREVCLLAVSPHQAAWEAGDRVTWSGRAYRVETTQVRAGGEGWGESDARRYVHLAEAGGG